MRTPAKPSATPQNPKAKNPATSKCRCGVFCCAATQPRRVRQRLFCDDVCSLWAFRTLLDVIGHFLTFGQGFEA